MKFRGPQCDMQIRIIVESEDSFIVQHNNIDHSCDDAPIESKSKVQLSQEIVDRIQSLFRSGTRMPKQVQKVLRSDRARNDIAYDSEPKIGQIKYQLQKYKKEIMGSGEISLGELKQFLDTNAEVPDDIDEPFVLSYDVKFPKKQTLDISENEDTDYEDDDDFQDNNENDTQYDVPSFWFLFTTVRLLQLLTMTMLIAADSTFKLVWQGFSGILIGTVDKKKQYHKICFGMSSSEKTSDWAEMFKVRIYCAILLPLSTHHVHNSRSLEITILNYDL